MALIVEDGTGKTNADSLASVEAAGAFQNANNSIDRWNEAEPTAIEAALRQATRWVCTGFEYQGTKTSSDQALCFPRKGLYDEDDVAVATNIVPQRVIDAVSLLALYALDGPLIDPKPGIKSRTVGGASQTFASAHNIRNFGEARLLLKPFIARSLIGPSVGLIRVN